MKSGIIRQIIRKLLDNLNMQSKLLVNGERTNTVTFYVQEQYLLRLTDSRFI